MSAAALTPRQLAEELLRLDAAATPAPWENDIHAGEDGPYLCLVTMRKPNGEPKHWIHVGRFDYGEDERAPQNKQLVSFARNHAATIARALIAAEDALKTIRETVNRQAEDEGLWFRAKRAPEAYLQQEFRKLHETIEAASPAAGGKDET